MFGFVYRFLDKIGYSHPIHPTVVHTAIGLVVGTLIFALVAVLLHRDRLRFTPRQCLALAFIWIFPTMLLGLMDWQHFYGGELLFPIKVKLVTAPLLAILMVGAILLGRKYGAQSKATISVYFLCFCTVVVLGYFGGQLVYGSGSSPSLQQYKAGQKIFVANCSPCHPHGGNVIKPSLPLKGSPKLVNLETFLGFIRNPRMLDGSKGAMPAFSQTNVPAEEAKALYEYITHVLERLKKQ
jgi:uncharacterized membrane protein